MIQFSWSHFHDLQLWNHSHTWGGWEFELLALGCSRKPNHNDHHHRRLRMGCSGGVPWDSSTHKGGRHTEPPFSTLQCTALHSDIYAPPPPPQWTFPSKKVLFRSLPEVLGDQIVDFSGHSEQEYLLILAENPTHSNQHQHLLTTAMDTDVKMWHNYADN